MRAVAFGRFCGRPRAALALGARGLLLVELLLGLLQLLLGLIGHPPDEYIGDDPESIKADIVEGLVPLLDEDFDVLLFAHGTPITNDGKRRCRSFVESSRAV